MGCSASTEQSQKDMVIEDKQDKKPLGSNEIMPTVSPTDKTEEIGESSLQMTAVVESTVNDANGVAEHQKVVEAVISYMEANSEIDAKFAEDDVSVSTDIDKSAQDMQPMSEEQVAVEKALGELKESVFGAPIVTSTADTQSNGSFTEFT